MTYKIYLIKHLDTDKKYVGITGADLGTRWRQHASDPNSAVNEAIKREGYRMTMELLEEVDTKDEALRKEQTWIHALGTAEPLGWNRRVSAKPEPEKLKTKKWEKIEILTTSFNQGDWHTELLCPKCGSAYTHQVSYSIFNRTEDAQYGTHIHITEDDAIIIDKNIADNPSSRRQGLTIFFECEGCGEYDYTDAENPRRISPPFQVHIYQHKGITHLRTTHYEESTS